MLKVEVIVYVLGRLETKLLFVKFQKEPSTNGGFFYYNITKKGYCETPLIGANLGIDF
jgi:hypothetical protein